MGERFGREFDFQSRGKIAVAACDNEWRILRELAKQQSAASALKDRLSQDKPITRYAFYTCIGRLRAWGWLRGHRTAVTVYTITDQGVFCPKRRDGTFQGLSSYCG
jgi:hypothetical protein